MLLEEIYRGNREPAVVNDLSVEADRKRGLLALAKLIYGAEKDPAKFAQTKAALISAIDTPFADDVDGTILEYIRVIGT